MKNLLPIAIIVVAFTMLSCVQKLEENAVPEKALSTFNMKFLDAKKVKWEMEEDSNWEAEFKLNGKKYSAKFNTSGDWLETEYEIEYSELAEKVKNVIQLDFSEYIVKKSEVTQSDKGIAYEIVLNRGENSVEILISQDGRIIEKKVLKGKAEAASWNKEFTADFAIDNCTFSTTGKNPYFILVAGFQLTLKSSEDDEEMELIITVLNETKTVNGIETRVVEERESVNGEIEEISRNYFAFCEQTGSIFYFGEQVDMYEEGKITSHSGAWLAEGKNKAGVIMPGLLLLGARYYQEIAPEVAMDRAEIISISENFETPAGSFTNVLKTQETNALNPNEKEFKLYAPGIGLIKDETLLLVKYGYIN